MLALYHCTPADEVSFFSEPNMSITVILDIHVLGHLNMKLFWSPVVPYRCIRLCALILNTAWALKQIYRNFHYVTAKIAGAVFLHCSKWLTEHFKWFLSWMTQLKKLFPITKDTLQSNRISFEYGCVQGCQSHSETVLAFARLKPCYFQYHNECCWPRALYGILLIFTDWQCCFLVSDITLQWLIQHSKGH